MKRTLLFMSLPVALSLAVSCGKTDTASKEKKEAVLKIMPQRWERDNFRFYAEKYVTSKKALHFREPLPQESWSKQTSKKERKTMKTRRCFDHLPLALSNT